MSELKAFNSERIYWAVEHVEREAGDIDRLHLDDNWFFLKSEVDKQIKELEENHKKEVGQLLIEIAELKKEKEYTVEQTTDVINGQERELRHQMYKWCLAMAKWCFTKSNYHFVLARHGEDVKENNRKSILYSKWHKRWLAIADKFKEAK